MAGIFKAYDIRGEYPGELDEDLARRIGRAYVTLTGSRTVAVGRDCRLSSPQLSQALMDGIRTQGAEVLDLGLCSTPSVYVAARRYGTIMVTASHNPAKDNGLKLCRKDCIPIASGSGMEELETLVHANAFAPATPGGYRTGDIIPEYAEEMRAWLTIKRPLKVVVDCAHAMSTLTIPPVIENAPLDVRYLCKGMDGRFPSHEPNPLKPANTRDLQDAVRANGADIGIAFDGDCDRVFFVDEKGRRIESDKTMVLIARHFLARAPGAKVLYAVNCSKVAREEIGTAGGVALPTRIGHAPAKLAMRREGAVFGAEISGHYYYRDFNWCDSGELTAALFLSILSAQDRPLSELVDPLLRYAKSEELNFKVKDVDAATKAVEAAYAGGKTHRIDGLTVEYPGWWFNLRPSNTEPLLRLNLEADTQAELDRRTHELGDIIQQFRP